MVQTVYYFMDNWLSHFAPAEEVHNFSTMLVSCSLATPDRMPAGKPTCHQIMCYCKKLFVGFFLKKGVIHNSLF